MTSKHVCACARPSVSVSVSVAVSPLFACDSRVNCSTADALNEHCSPTVRARHRIACAPTPRQASGIIAQTQLRTPDITWHCIMISASEPHVGPGHRKTREIGVRMQDGAGERWRCAGKGTCMSIAAASASQSLRSKRRLAAEGSRCVSSCLASSHASSRAPSPLVSRHASSHATRQVKSRVESSHASQVTRPDSAQHACRTLYPFCLV